ncbi:MAG: hypothetical protein E6G59_09250 [Actinobacteria bacterium]|nr:MAG: hypothetical protein E6G59_09250 [Actinomycetota bacterium]
MIERFFEQADIPYKLVAEGRWAAQLRGERKHTIPLGVALSSDRVVFESFFMRRPQENKDAFYELIVGSILIEADGLFNAAIEIGFKSYLEADMAWRARNAEASS